MTRPDALSFVGVTKRYGRGRRATLALDGVSWSIPVGARACLLGPNGAGKSTSIRLLQGALQVTSGQVALLGATVGSEAYWEARRRTGIVPQGPGMYRDVTTREYLELARTLYGCGDVTVALERYGLAEHAGKMLLQLSGGLQRRVSLAAALLAEPDVLLLDEPTVGLDPVAAREVHQTLRRAMEHRTTLLCTHNLAEAEALCDEVVILRAGKVLVHESLAELRRRFAATAAGGTALVLRARQGAAALAAGVSAAGFTVHSEDGVVRVPVEEAERDAPVLLRRLLDAGLDVYECRPVQASLEDVFLAAVRGGDEPI